MAAELKRRLMRKILQRAVGAANEDPAIREELSKLEGERGLFVVTGMGSVGFEMTSKGLFYVENPNPKDYDFVIATNEDAFIYMLKGYDPVELFWRGYIDVYGRGWLSKFIVIRRVLDLGVERGLKKALLGLA